LNLLVFAVLLLNVMPAAVLAMPAEPLAAPTPAAPIKLPPGRIPQLGTAPRPDGGIESLSGSNVTVPLPLTVLAPQNIEVTPSSLAQALCSDAIATQQITICNTGDLPLTWQIDDAYPCMERANCTPGPQVGRPVQLKLDAAPQPGSGAADPPATLSLVSLVLDDGSRENDLGVGGTWEFIWLNRFTPSPSDFPFSLEEVQVYFSSAGLVSVGDSLVLAVYENTSGSTDPAIGSSLLATFPVTVQALDTWNVYYPVPPVLLDGPGDVIIGVIAMTVPGTSYWPAAIDQTATQARSWVGWWNASPPSDPPLLPPDGFWTLIDVYFPGNWMVRGYGGVCCCDLPWLAENPPAGTLAPHTCEVVDVTFDSTGLAAGDYYAGLLVESDDPDEPEVTIPVSLTVLAPTSGVDFSWSPLAPLAGETASFSATVATGTPPFTFDWDWGDGTTGSGQVATHAYGTPGDYPVVLTAGGACGEGLAQYTVTVEPELVYVYLPVVLKSHAP
jgi:hypothetical protein